MSLNMLEKKDDASAELIAAAALAINTPYENVQDKRRPDIERLLSQLREQLDIASDDKSSAATRQLEAVLLQALDALISNEELALAQERAGALGLLSPGAYKVIQPKIFLEQFREFGVRDKQVESAINSPDDYQHVLANDDASEKNKFSLFMKEMPARGRREKTWMLVQTFRDGLKQIAQAAWWIYPSEVDMSDCATPLDVLRKFAIRYGAPITIGKVKAKFINAIDLPASEDVKINIQLSGDFFASWSTQETKDPSLGRVGIAYAIDLKEYRKTISLNA
jgi:hypothetical protein